MFEYVNFEVKCPTCQKDVTDFQTKDFSCNYLETLEYWEVDNFYSSCDYCNTWIDFTRKEKKPYVPIEHYKITIKSNDTPEHRIIRNKNGKIIGFLEKE